MRENQRVVFANTLRGLAALCVVVSHYLGVFWLWQPGVAQYTNMPPLPVGQYGVPIYVAWLNGFPPLNWGPFGVALFFIISGFVIPFSLAKSSAAGFLLNRAIRIYPVYIAGLAVTLSAIYFGSRVYGSPWPFTLDQVLLHLPGLDNVVWTPDIDGIIWTLQIEVKFYLVCAAAILLFRKRSNLVFLLPVGIFVAAELLLPTRSWMATLLGVQPELYREASVFLVAAHYVIFMFIGVAFHYAYIGRISFEKAAALIGLFFLLFCLLWSNGPYSQGLVAAWNYGFALLLFALAYNFPRFFENRKIFDFFAGVSYPLYVCHAMAGYVALHFLVEAGVPATVSIAVAIAGAIIAAWLIHVVIELPSQRFYRQFCGRHASIAVNSAATLEADAAVPVKPQGVQAA